MPESRQAAPVRLARSISQLRGDTDDSLYFLAVRNGNRYADRLCVAVEERSTRPLGFECQRFEMLKSAAHQCRVHLKPCPLLVIPHLRRLPAQQGGERFQPDDVVLGIVQRPDQEALQLHLDRQLGYEPSSMGELVPGLCQRGGEPERLEQDLLDRRLEFRISLLEFGQRSRSFPKKASTSLPFAAPEAVNGWYPHALGRSVNSSWSGSRVSRMAL